MFAGLKHRSRWPRSLAFSLALHLAAILCILWAIPEILLMTPAVKRANLELTKLVTAPGSITARSIKAKNKVPQKARHLRPQQKTQLVEEPAGPPAPEPLGPVLRTSALWQVSGYHEVRIALPQVTPSPAITRSELPDGFQGDIIVEVTINKEGKVVRTKVLQTFGTGLESRVVAALLDWRFKPATYDGVPIASLQDIYFHFPDSAMP